MDGKLSIARLKTEGNGTLKKCLDAHAMNMAHTIQFALVIDFHDQISTANSHSTEGFENHWEEKVILLSASFSIKVGFSGFTSSCCT